MAQAARYQHFPRAGLIAAGCAVALTIAAAGLGRITGPVRTVEPSKPLVSLELRFEDRDDGGVAVIDASTGRTVDVVAATTNGFLRATLRGLTRQRIQQDFGPETPFRLTRWADGRLTLEDPAIHRTVELEAFGETNEAAFARLLPRPGATR